MMFLDRLDLQCLIEQLLQLGFDVIGPRVDQGAIVYDSLRSIGDLPKGWTDEQGPGRYRLVPSGEEMFFGYVIGPHAWKKYLFPPLLDVLRSRRDDDQQWTMEVIADPPVKRALLGVRACELAAIAIQDRVFMSDTYVDSAYATRRHNLFLIAVNCAQAASTCFCTSMDTGPRCTQGFDLALSEIDDGFVVEVGSEAGAELAERLPLRPATPLEIERADQRTERAVHQITKRLDTTDIHDKLLSRLDHPQWQDVAERCLSCANCTMVCPTCFCSSVDEVSDLTNDEIVRQRRWDSCFNVDFSHCSGGAIRHTTRSRYRQWLTHKLASWVDQFGMSGCVGCGRCITWCPVGIDLTQEVATICEDTPVCEDTP